MDVYVGGKKIHLDPTSSIGKGGEADIFKVGVAEALKVFKAPNHPDYALSPDEQTAARLRIVEHQKKLPAFPRNLPTRVVKPDALATDRAGSQILGYQMTLVDGAEVLLRYGERAFRQAGIPSELISKLFLDLHGTVEGIHRAGVVIGDFNDLNILVRGTEAYLIDADSMQFGPFLTRVFTARFVDPLLCDPKETSLLLAKPHTADSDWYAYAVMLMQCLLYVGPYGGVFRPKNLKQTIPHDARPLHRITVFHPDVRYPKPAIPYGVLPDELLNYFHLVFEKDQREEFPRRLVEAIRWTACSGCGIEHARSMCPNCALTAPIAVKEVTRIRGTVTATRMFKTSGVILFASMQEGELRWLYHESQEFRREDQSVVTSGALDPHMRFRLQGKTSLLGKGGQLIAMSSGVPERIAVSTYGSIPMFDGNDRHRYWTSGGQLFRNDTFAPFLIGDVVDKQTLFWVGPKFGFGLTRAGNLNIAFVFDAERRGINDSVKLPPITGQLVDATAVFSGDRCWFFVALQENGKTINRCIVISALGVVEAIAEGTAGDGSWLGAIRGKCAAGNFLLAATDEGVVRVEPSNSQIVKTREFPDTEPFVDAGSYLFATNRGLYAVGRQEIYLLKIA